MVALLIWTGASYATFELSEKPAMPGEWGYRPDDVVVDVNPPGFSWRPTGDATTYVLQIAETPDFKKVAYTRDDIPWSAHCPSEALPEGAYYWRYAAKNDAFEQSLWSKIRTFRIAPDTVQCPQPTREELARRMPKEHPRLFFRPEEVEPLRALAKGDFAGRYAELVKQAGKLLENPPDTSEPPKYPEKGYRTKNPGEWKKIWWGNRTRVIAVADGAATLGFVYQLSGEEKYAKAAREWLLAMAQWDEKGSTCYSYNDEAAMPALYMTSRAYSWIHKILNEDDCAQIAAMMRERGKQCYARLGMSRHLWRPYESHNNRAWHFLGELAIAFYDDIPEAPEWLDYAMTILYTTYPVWGDATGGWHEGSAYWASYTGRFMYWAYVVRAAFEIDVFERPFYHRAGYFGLYTIPPGSKTGGFGDLAITTSSNRIASLMAILANGAKNPHWKWYADTCGGSVGGGYLGFLYAARGATLEGTPPTDLPASTCFPGIGVAVLNTDLIDGTKNIQVHFKSSPFGSPSHGYDAQNSFLLSMHGQRALIRTGKRDVHGSPHHREWMWQTKAQNAILVNGEGQIPHTPMATGRILAFETSPTVDVVVGEAGDAYKNLDRWTRRLIFFKPDAIVIHDILEAPEPSTFQWRLHAIESPFAIEGQTAKWSGPAGKANIQFLEPNNLTFAQTDQYDTPPGDFAKIPWPEHHLTADAQQKTKTQQFLTLITLNDAKIDVEYTPGAPANLTLTRPKEKAELHLSPNNFKLKTPDFEKVFSD